MSCKITHFYLESNILLSNFLFSCLITIELPFPLLNIIRVVHFSVARKPGIFPGVCIFGRSYKQE